MPSISNTSLMRITKIILFPLLIGFWFVFCASDMVSAQTLGTATEPARLRDLEPIVVQLIYVVWGLGSLLLTIILAYIGFLYMTSLGDGQKKEEAKERGGKWLISVLIFYLAYPVLLTIYNVAGVGESNDCYADISTPGFHFFFPDVCTDPQAGSLKYDSMEDCTNFSPDELSLLAQRRNCCLSIGAANITIPAGVGIESGQNVFTYDAGKGICTGVTSCRVGTADCEAKYVLTGSGSNYSVDEKK